MMMAERYRALARVGVGGTAVVYRCRDLHTQRIVAVKALKSNAANAAPEAAKRFRREARLAAHLSHPNIVRVLDYGFTLPVIVGPQSHWSDDPDKPVPYLAMEYIFGATLKDLLRRVGPLPLDWVWRIGDQLCSALAMAHSVGVVHRDVKPQNVMLLDSPLELLAKLADFGIARQIGGDLTALTATGQVIGTPDYLSPEQVLGEPGGPSSDLYSLGIVLYELVTGRLPFEADTPLAAASKRMMIDAPPLTAYRRDTPAALQEVILVALRREMSERFQSAAEFAEALRWSRRHAPEQPEMERGSWLAPGRSEPRQQSPVVASEASEASEAAPVASEGELDLSQQSTVLRVMLDLSPDSAPEPTPASGPESGPDA
ncbi:MAG TPA: serine/threonine-protein kinase [Ktedonobacterales bacterium]